MTAEEYYRLGNECRQRGDWKHAIENYNEAIELDPQSPAVEAKQMVRISLTSTVRIYIIHEEKPCGGLLAP